MHEIERELLVTGMVVVDMAHLRTQYYSTALINQVHERDVSG